MKLYLWKKSYDQPRQHTKKQRHHFANKVPSKAMVFPVVMYGCESWTLTSQDTSNQYPLLVGASAQWLIFSAQRDTACAFP